VATKYRSGAKYLTMPISAPAHSSVLNDVFAEVIVPLIAVGRFKLITLVKFTLQNLKDSVINKQ
jgi:hypothetical protein